MNEVFGVRITSKISARDAVLLSRRLVFLCSFMATKQPLKPASGNAKKRKSSDRNDAEDNDKPPGHQPKQPKINAFFTPRVSLSTTCGTDKTTSVAKLSEEQCGVLQHVVEEGKSVFFTGSAGACSGRSVTAADA